MKNLKEVLNIVTSRRLKNIETLNNLVLSDKAQKVTQLYDGIIDGKFKNDEEAAKALYNADSRDTRYTTLKTRFKKRLYNNLFYLDANNPSYSSYESAIYTCQKNLALCRILANHSARLSAVELAAKTLSMARKYMFTEIVIGCSMILKNHAMLTGDQQTHKRYWKLIQDHQDIAKAESEAEHYYQDLIIHFSKSISAKKELSDLARLYYEALLPKSKAVTTFPFQFDFHRIWAMMFQTNGNYVKALAVFETFEHYLDNYEVFKERNIQAKVCMYKLDCYLHLSDFDNGEREAVNGLELFDTSNINRYIFLETYFLLSLRTANYGRALEVLTEVLDYHRFQYFPKNKQEIWRIYEAYINFLIETGELSRDQLEDGQKIKRFDAAQFLDDVPIFKKDKRGYNVAILVIQILFMLSRQEYGRIIDRMDALRLYRSRHLKGEEDLRSKVFIKLLLIMEKQSFEYAPTREKAQKYFEELPGHPFHYEGSPIDAEIIPYETLWGMVLDILKKQ